MFGTSVVDNEDSLISQSSSDGYGTKKSQTRARRINTAIVLAVLLIFIIVVVILIIVYWPTKKDDDKKSATGRYAHAAVATDAAECSTIGKDILLRNGSAVDAAIAAMLCIGLHNAQSCGIGGGFFLIVHDVPNGGNTKEILAYDAREVAPLAATERMFPPNTTLSSVGGKAIAVPGEIKGYHEAWKKFGRLPWNDLFQPTIRLCEKGFKVGWSLSKFIRREESAIRSTPSLKELFVKEDGSLYKEGDVMRMPKLGVTLRRIAANATDFYTGSLAADIISDITEVDGIITLEDLKQYAVNVTKPLSMNLPNSGLMIHTLRPPSSGPIFAFILKLLDGYNLTSTNLDGTSRSTDTYHRIIESFKFGFALRSYLGDEHFEDLSVVMKNLTSEDFVKYIRSRITMNETHDIPYYDPQFNHADSGTSHLSILAPDGGAVSATTTINNVFGAQRVGNKTGIIFNDEMDDFSSPDKSTTLGRENFIKPGKRPLSSMCPAIFLDKDNNTVLLLGAAGGIKITPAAAYVAIHNLWLGMEIDQAVDHFRLHHQLQPNYVTYENGFQSSILKLLESEKHHVVKKDPDNLTGVVQAIHSTCHKHSSSTDIDSESKCIVAVSDWRKKGKPDGY